jgi:hypothetical protein
VTPLKVLLLTFLVARVRFRRRIVYTNVFPDLLFARYTGIILLLDTGHGLVERRLYRFLVAHGHPPAAIVGAGGRENCTATQSGAA